MTTYLGKSCSFCLPRVSFVNCRQFIYLVISLLVLRAGYGIWLYQFLIIAYLFTLHIRALVVVPCGGLKSLPVHSFNALIIPILRGCLQSLFNIPVPWYRFDTVLKVTSWPAFVSRCIIDAYFSFYGLVLDIDMNCGCRLYRSFWQMDLTYAMDCLLNSITGMNVAFLLTVSPSYTQLWLSQTD